MLTDIQKTIESNVEQAIKAQTQLTELQLDLVKDLATSNTEFLKDVAMTSTAAYQGFTPKAPTEVFAKQSELAKELQSKGQAYAESQGEAMKKFSETVAEVVKPLFVFPTAK